MRKVTAIFILLAIIMAFTTACGNNSDETTAAPTIGTQYIPTTSATETTEQISDSTTDVPTYVLTTNPDKTVPVVATTRFEISESSTTGSYLTTGNGDYNVSFNVSAVSKPDVNMSQIPTTITTTAPPKTTADDEPTTADKDAEPVALLVNSYGYGEGVIYVEIDPSNWEGGFMANTQSITVKVDGAKLSQAVACKVPSKKTGDNYEIKIDLSSQNVKSGALVEFTIPSGIVKNTAGTQYNLSYSASVTV